MRPAADTGAAARDALRLSTLLEVSQALSGTLNLKAGLQRVLGILVRRHGVVRGMVTLLRDGELHVEAAEGFYELIPIYVHICDPLCRRRQPTENQHSLADAPRAYASCRHYFCHPSILAVSRSTASGVEVTRLTSS